MLPFLLFAGNDVGDPIILDVSGGTNVSFSLSYEYFDQVLMPTLEERFDIKIKRELKRRGWGLGPLLRGSVWLKVQPLAPGQKIVHKHPPRYTFPESYKVSRIDVSVITPIHSHKMLSDVLVKHLGDLFPSAEVHFKVIEDSCHNARWSVLLVAHSSAGIRWAKDILCSAPKNVKSYDIFISQLSKKLCKGLYEEIALRGHVDEHLQDQIVIFQALCDGVSSFPRTSVSEEQFTIGSLANDTGPLDNEGVKLKKDKTHEPFGNGTMHTKTVRWVASELLPGVGFFAKGNVVQGNAFSVS